MTPPSDGPIPMSLAESIVGGEAMVHEPGDRFTPRERRMIEQLIRHARTARRSASTATDVTGLLISTRDDLRELEHRLTSAIDAARTSVGTRG